MKPSIILLEFDNSFDVLELKRQKHAGLLDFREAGVRCELSIITINIC